MKTTNNNEQGQRVFAMGTAISDAPSWWASLVRQIRELRQERKNPPAPVEITAEKDPTALLNLVETKSPISSLFTDVRDAIHDALHPRRIETTVAPVEVEEIWSKERKGVPTLLSVAVHCMVIVLLLIPWATRAKVPPVNETAVMVYTPSNLILNLPQTDDQSGGGGGGGKRQITPPSLGKLPRPADKQFVPPDPEPPKNPDPTLIVEPTVVAPQLAQL